jgi:hypothetical protein
MGELFFTILPAESQRRQVMGSFTEDNVLNMLLFPQAGHLRSLSEPMSEPMTMPVKKSVSKT